MKKLKYIKIFEAFESNKLSKILGYVSKESKEQVINIIKKIFAEYDFPESEISDKYVEYLPFKKALMKASDVTDTKCTGNSKDQFGRQHGIEGEVCDLGKIKRKWGSTIRTVVCKSCDGTGISNNIKSDIKLLKLWFSSEGDYITTSCVDGIIRNNIANGKLSNNPNDYEIVKSDLTYNDIIENNYYRININSTRNVYVYIIKENRRFYAIQNDHDGQPPNDNSYKKIGRYSWILDHTNFSNLKLLKKVIKDDDKLDTDIDPYTWNTSVYIGRRIIEVRYKSIKDTLSNANFALIIDVNKLKLSEYTKKTKTREKRSDSISNALALRSNDDIKSENINRYIDKLSDKIRIKSDDILEIKKVINKLLINNNLFYTINDGRATGILYKLMESYSELLSPDNSEDRKIYILDNISSSLKKIYSENFTKNRRISDNLNYMLKNFKNNTDDISKDKYNFLLKTIELNSLLKEMIKSVDIETIYDMEILYGKLLTIKNALDSRRYGKFGRMGYLSYMTRENSEIPLSEFSSSYRGFESIMLEQIEDFKKLIKRI